MNAVVRGVRASLLVAIIGAAALPAMAGAATFNVATTGTDTNSCGSAATPCKTIARALLRSEASAGPATVAVGPGTFHEDVALRYQSLSGITLRGAGESKTVIEGVAGQPTLAVDPQVAATVSDLEVVRAAGDSYADVSDTGALVLRNDRLRTALTASGAVIEANGTAGRGSLAVFGGHIESAGVAAEPAIAVDTDHVRLSGTRVDAYWVESSALRTIFATTVVEHTTLDAHGPSAAGVSGYGSIVNLASDHVITETTGSDAVHLSGSDVSLTRSSLRADGEGAYLENTHATLATDAIEVRAAVGSGIDASSGTALKADRVSVRMNNATNLGQGIRAYGADFVALTHVTVGGTWIGSGISGGTAGQVRISDSHVALSKASTRIGIALGAGYSGGLAFLLRRTSVIVPVGASAAVEYEPGGDAIIDSSLLVGGRDALSVSGGGPKRSSVTVVASTIDAAVPGTSDGGLARSLFATQSGVRPTTQINVAGSVLLEPIEADLITSGGSLTVRCSSSDVRSQFQPHDSSHGEIACRAGSRGNKAFASPGAIFASPGSTYLPRPHGNIVDSVISRTIKLPHGQRPSATDLYGRRRAVRRRVGGGCVLVQDRGAAQVRGQRPNCR